MKPPVFALALISAFAPAQNFESIAGDLEEEFVKRVERDGCSSAKHWYWYQAIGSIPSLLAYPRADSGFGSTLTAGVFILIAIVALLFSNEFIDDAIRTFYHTTRGIGAWPFFVSGWLDAALFGASVAAVYASQGMRMVCIAALTLLAFIVLPILLHLSSSLSAPAWLLVLGALPAIIAGGGVYHVARRHRFANYI